MSTQSPQMKTYTITLINFNGSTLRRRIRSWSHTEAKETAAEMAQGQNWVKGWAVTGFEVTLQNTPEAAN